MGIPIVSGNKPCVRPRLSIRGRAVTAGERHPLRALFGRTTFALAVAIAVCASGATAAERGVLDYKVYFGGFAVVALEFDFERTAEDYRIVTKLRTIGMIDKLFPWTMRSYTRGRTAGTELGPEATGQTSAWRGRERIIDVRYDDDRPIVARVVPTPDQDEREPVSDEDVRGTVDLASAVLSLSLAAQAGRGCGDSLPVFDGRRRYDLIVERIGIEQIHRFGKSGTGYRALKCRVTMVRRAGFMKITNRDESDSDRHSGLVWLAPVEAGMPPVPVRIEVDSRWGLMIAHLTRARDRRGPSAEAEDTERRGQPGVPRTSPPCPIRGTTSRSEAR